MWATELVCSSSVSLLEKMLFLLFFLASLTFSPYFCFSFAHSLYVFSWHFICVFAFQNKSKPLKKEKKVNLVPKEQLTPPESQLRWFHSLAEITVFSITAIS